MFTGQYDYSLDDRGRVPVPPKYRTDFKGGLFVTKGLDTCLSVYTPERWEKLAADVMDLPFTDPVARDMRRMMASPAFELEVDKQGRILLPAALRDHAQLQQSVSIVGAFDCLEIWDAEKWRVKLEQLAANPPQIPSQR